MNRQEAAKVLDEVMRRCNGATLTRCVILNQESSHSTDQDNYELQIDIGPNDCYSALGMDAVLKKHKLTMKKSDKIITLYQPEQKS